MGTAGPNGKPLAPEPIRTFWQRVPTTTAREFLASVDLVIDEVSRSHSGRHTTFCVRVMTNCTDLYLTTLNTQNRKTSMPPTGFEPAILAIEWSYIHALDCAATGIGLGKQYLPINHKCNSYVFLSDDCIMIWCLSGFAVFCPDISVQVITRHADLSRRAVYGAGLR
jgi:hypothetical protein